VPAAIRYQTELAQNVAALKAAGVKADVTLLNKITALITSLGEQTEKLAEIRSHHVSGLEAEAAHYCRELLPQLLAIRKEVDALEAICPDESWPVPTYEEMLFIRYFGAERSQEIQRPVVQTAGRFCVPWGKECQCRFELGSIGVAACRQARPYGKAPTRTVIGITDRRWGLGRGGHAANQTRA
jgi:hypothetical protein